MSVSEPSSGEESVQSKRSLGLVMLAVAAIICAMNYGLSATLGLYFPFLLLFVGPLLTMGFLTTIHPRFFDALVSNDRKHGSKFFRWISIPLLLLGLLFGVMLWAKFRGDLG